MSEEYTPDEVDLRDAWVHEMIESKDWPIETGIFYAEKALAKIKADALREAADGIQAMDSRATLRGIATSIRVEADRIERDHEK